MRRVTLVVVPFLAALFVAREVAQETPTATLAARYTSTPPIVQLTATPTAEAGAPAFCQRTASWTPSAALPLYSTQWGIQINEVRVETEAVVQIDETARFTASPTPGSLYVTVFLSVTNVSTNVLAEFPQIDLRLFDDQGRTYEFNAGLTAPWFLVLDAPLANWEPGGTYHAAAVYQIPDDAKPAGLVAADGSLCVGLPTEGTPTA
jgi:hypothetical protein